MRFFMSGMAAVLLVATTGPTSAGQQNIIIREHLGQRWTRELVTYPFAAEKGQCHPNSIKLIGPDGPVPVQVTDVVTWPDAPHVKTAKLTFVVDVASGANDTYKVQYAEVATRLIRPKTDLKVARGQGQIEFVTDQFGIRLLVGEKTYPEPVAPAEAPAPVLAMRQPDGTWFGGSRLYGATKIKSYSATLAADGPALGRVDYRYTYADGVTMDLSVQLAAGDSQVRYAMNVLPVDREQVLKDLRGGGFDWRNHPSLAPRGPSKQDGWRLLLSPGLEPLQLVAVPEFGQVRWGKREYVRGKPVFNPVTVDIEKEPVGLLVSLVPWADWWEQMTKTEMTLKTAQRGEVLTARSLEPGEWVEPAEPGEWISWGNRRSTQKWVPLVHGGEGEVFFQVSRASGRRTFLVGGAGQPLGRRFNELKDYVLDWEPGKLGHPRLFLNAEQLAEARKHKPDAERLARLARLAGSGIPSKPHRVDGRALAIWLLTGDPEQARKHKLVERLRRHLALLGKFDTMRHASLVCSLYDGVIGSELVTEADRKEFRAGLAYLAYQVADPATWSMERGYCSGNLNMSVAHVLNRGTLACALADHPMAETWKTSALAMLDRWLETRVGPDGEWPESVANYAFVSVGHLLPMAIAARNAGFANYIDDPRMRRLMLYLAKQYTPPDPRHTEGDKDGAIRTGRWACCRRSGAAGPADETASRA
jgi:hypothetical protein